MSVSAPGSITTGNAPGNGSRGETDGVAQHIWETRYRHGGERSFSESLRRVAQALAVEEGNQRQAWEERFFEIMCAGRFLPAGRILAGAGTGRRVTLANCFVMGVIEDSIDGIFRAL